MWAQTCIIITIYTINIHAKYFLQQESPILLSPKLWYKSSASQLYLYTKTGFSSSQNLKSRKWDCPILPQIFQVAKVASAPCISSPDPNMLIFGFMMSPPCIGTDGPKIVHRLGPGNQIIIGEPCSTNATPFYTEVTGGENVTISMPSSEITKDALLWGNYFRLMLTNERKKSYL